MLAEVRSDKRRNLLLQLHGDEHVKSDRIFRFTTQLHMG